MRRNSRPRHHEGTGENGHWWHSDDHVPFADRMENIISRGKYTAVLKMVFAQSPMLHATPLPSSS